MADNSKRKITVWILGGGMLLLFLLLGALNAFNFRFLHPRSIGQIFLFTSLSVVVFLLFVVVLILLFRNILKLFADQRSRVLGSRLRSRMLLGAVLLSFAPALFMFAFSYGLMNRSIDRWFSQPTSQLREDSTRVALALEQYASANARAEAGSLASSEGVNRGLQNRDSAAILEEMENHRLGLEGGFAMVYRDGKVLAEYQVPNGQKLTAIHSWLDDSSEMKPPAGEPLNTTVLSAAQRADNPIVAMGSQEYSLGIATSREHGVVVVGLPLPQGLSTTVESIRTGARDYWILFRARNRIRSTYLLLLLLLTALIFFSSSWLALFLSKQITRPVEELADAMGEIAAGHYKHRIQENTTQELGELIRSFNHMAADLEESRTLAETSTTKLSAANLALDERRRELETILETIPNGVVTLDPDLRVLQANRAFTDLTNTHGRPGVQGLPLNEILPEEIAEELMRLVRRSHRMGMASTEFEMRGPGGMVNLAATMASLVLQDGKRGSILVLEDVTEALRAQRQVAWKEVAQRVAHEIKNPLTPIGLSAERIRRHIDRNVPESPAVIRKCSEVILGSVETMRTLVDQFGALAQFPTAQPKPTDLKQVIESSLMLFAGRMEGIRIKRHMDAKLPLVMVDAEGMKRALANLIDNAAEAMQGSLVKVLTIETALNESHGAAEIILADTGHGLTDDMRERLFLPYFSTKQRGTGLGLAIAAKIIQEHHGTIRAESNTPAGARFIVELPLAENGAGNEPAPWKDDRTPA
ncbi:MAG TPA: ATP-binding protein [Acidisarcina sp.]|nr:ATP-binding protein [Acidisarcina sp.]